MKRRWNLQRELFDAASKLKPEEREAFLEQACVDDPSMRQTVEALLREHDEEDDPIQDAVRVAATETLVSDEPVTGVIGPYRILRKIGEGGMGVVFEAEQENPRRRVAVKVIRGGQFVDETRLKMFRREAQSLGRLKHQNIASIYEAGSTGDGQHFFAMELVRGEPLNELMHRGDMSTGDRLQLFRKICKAIHYAHQRGVIHRDLKPSNILIESSGEPKILDFGLARITDADVAITTVATDVGKIKGTLAYMSPEQARGNPDEIDVRSDVYSLGVLLYELVTGRLPYDVGKVMLHEALRVICDEPPRRPSTVDRALRGDIETIAMKSLSKEPELRYQSADALAEDISRYLDDQPILARPPSTVYQLKKLVSRHRGLFGSAIAIVVALTVGLIASTTLYLRAESARAEAGSERDRANVEAASAQRVTDFLIDMFRSSDPSEARGDTVTARDLLDRGSERIDSLQDEPRVQARLMSAMGQVHHGLGLFDSAGEMLEQAYDRSREVLGDEHPETLAAALAWADLLVVEAEYKRAESVLDQIIEVRTRMLGKEHPDTADARQRLAGVYSGLNRLQDALMVQREVLEIQRRVLGDEHEQTMQSMDTLSGLVAAEGNVRESLEILEPLLVLRRKVLGDDHPSTLKTMSDTAASYSVLGREAEAEALYKEVLQKQREILGDDHLETLMTIGNLAIEYFDGGRFDEAEPLFMELRGQFASQMGEDHPFTALASYHVGRVHNVRGRWKEAEASLRHALGGTWDLKDIQTHLQRVELGVALTGQGRCAEAEPLMLPAHELIHASDGDERDAHERQVLQALIGLYETWGRPDLARPFIQELSEVNDRA